MDVHDWTRVEAGVFHDFHTAWIASLRTELNGRLPEGYYALAEQHAGEMIADILTLHASPADEGPTGSGPRTAANGGVALAWAAPRTRVRQIIEPGPHALRRTLAIRHVSGHRLVAMIEIVWPGNKDRRRRVDGFVSKAIQALDAGVHLLLVDLFAPGTYDPHGLHTAIRQRLEDTDATFPPPPGEPLTLAAYAAGEKVEAYLEQLAVGGTLPEMPLFLQPERYVTVPLAETYDAAYRGMPAFWRDVLEGRGSAGTGP
jgi:hypothetical protein